MTTAPADRLRGRMAADLHQRMTDFLRDATSAHYEALRAGVVDHPAWNPYGDDLDELRALVDAGRWAELVPRFQAGMPTLMLNVQAHWLAAEAAERCGDANGAGMLRMVGRLLLAALRATGDGTEAHPWRVTSVHDQHGLLTVTGRRAVEQRLVERDGRRYDRMRCEDGGEVWFDITDMHHRLGLDLLASLAEGEG